MQMLSVGSPPAYTPLHLAVMGRHAAAVRVLVKAGADLAAKDDDGQTPLHWGAYAYAPQAMHIYAKLGQPHDTIYVDPGPAIAMQVLLAAGAPIHAVDREGNTPLHEAVLLRSPRAIELLLAHGANRDARNNAGETPRSLARSRPAVAQLLTAQP